MARGACIQLKAPVWSAGNCETGWTSRCGFATNLKETAHLAGRTARSAGYG